jgi:hypothetical protein
MGSSQLSVLILPIIISVQALIDVTLLLLGNDARFTDKAVYVKKVPGT